MIRVIKMKRFKLKSKPNNKRVHLGELSYL